LAQAAALWSALGLRIPDLLKELNDKGNEVIRYKEHPDIYKGDPEKIIEYSKKFTDNLKAFEVVWRV
jgi:hypothetical protein